MRVRITNRPPLTYRLDGDSLQVGRVYNLDASVAAALMVEGCAESYDLLSPDEKCEFRSRQPTNLWKAGDRVARPKGAGDPDPTA